MVPSSCVHLEGLAGEREGGREGREGREEVEGRGGREGKGGREGREGGEGGRIFFTLLEPSREVWQHTYFSSPQSRWWSPRASNPRLRKRITHSLGQVTTQPHVDGAPDALFDGVTAIVFKICIKTFQLVYVKVRG